MQDAKGAETYYGWKIVFSLLVILTFTSGLSFYNHSVYLNALAANPAFDIQSASFAVSLFFLSGGFAGLWVAKLVQRFDPRVPICIGAIICGVSLSLLPSIQSTFQLYFNYIIFGTGFAASALIPATTLVTRWFHRRRAMALSISSTGLSVGGVVVTPISVLLIGNLGFENAAPILGLMYVLGVIPLALLFLRPSPASMGLQIDGGSIVSSEEAKDKNTVQKTPVEDDGLMFEQAKKTRFFWGVATAYIFLMMAQVGGIAHQYGLVREQLNESQTAIAVAILPVASIIGRLLGGWIVGRLPIRPFAIGMMILQAISLAILASGASVFTLCLGLALFGASVGNILMLQPLLIADSFGLKDYAKIFSISNLMSSWGTALGPAILGFAYSASGNTYSIPYLLASIAGIVGLVLFVSGGSLIRSEC